MFNDGHLDEEKNRELMWVWITIETQSHGTKTNQSLNKKAMILYQMLSVDCRESITINNGLNNHLTEQLHLYQSHMFFTLRVALHEQFKIILGGVLVELLAHGDVPIYSLCCLSFQHVCNM